MTSTARQLKIEIETALHISQTERVTYRSEHLGYLPFGQYHWVAVEGNDLKVASPDSLREDLLALVSDGYLKILSHEQYDETDEVTEYALVSPAACLAR